MNDLQKKLHTAFRLSGFMVRREFCALIVQKFADESLPLDDKATFENYFRTLCTSLEKQCLTDKSIEREHIEQAVEVCLHSGCEKNETEFSVISAFEFPKFFYDPDRKTYLPSKVKSVLLSEPRSKAHLFVNRYTPILQRTERNFKRLDSGFAVQTVDFLLTSTKFELERTVILGSLLQVSDKKYFLEDPTGIVELDLSDTDREVEGFFVESTFVLVHGTYKNKIVFVSTLVLPPGEEYEDSRIEFGNLNYFGGPSSTLLRNSQNLKEQLRRNPQGQILLFSDVWLDNPQIFEKLEILFQGMEESSPPIAFVFMGNFMEELYGSHKIENLKALFKQFGELIGRFPRLLGSSEFVFVPGMTDPCVHHIVPRFSIPTHIVANFKKSVPKAVFATNPCRIQYCNKEIVLFRADLLVKLMQGAIFKPQDNIPRNIAKTIISQGHLSPLPLNALTVHWDFDYTLQLYPLPNLIVVGDKAEMYISEYKGCKVVNPGSFCESGFQFMCYTPYTDSLDECALE